MHKHLYQTLVVIALLVVLVFSLTSTVLADCTPDGTPGNNNITCDTITDSGDGNGNNALDANGVAALQGNDTIIVENGATVGNNINSGPDNDEITNNGTVNGNILAVGGDDIVDNNGDVNGNIRTANGQDDVDNSGTVTGNIVTGFAGDTINNSGRVNGTIDGESGRDEINNSGTVDGFLWGGLHNDEINNSGTVNQEITGWFGDDTITNSGTVAGDINGNDGDDTITNNGTVQLDLDGGDGADTITNNGLVEDEIEGEEGNDTITNNGTVRDDIDGDQGDDTIVNSGIVHGDIEAGTGNDRVSLTGTQVDGIIDGGPGTDTLDFSMETKNKSQYKAARAAIATGGDGSFAWINGHITWQNFEILIDNLTLLPGHSLKYLDKILKIIADGNGKLYFYGLNEDSDVYLAMLGYEIWSQATAGQVLLDVSNAKIDVRLIVTALDNGQLKIEYFSTIDGSALVNTAISP